MFGAHRSSHSLILGRKALIPAEAWQQCAPSADRVGIDHDALNAASARGLHEGGAAIRGEAGEGGRDREREKESERERARERESARSARHRRRAAVTVERGSMGGGELHR